MVHVTMGMEWVIAYNLQRKLTIVLNTCVNFNTSFILREKWLQEKLTRLFLWKQFIKILLWLKNNVLLSGRLLSFRMVLMGKQQLCDFFYIVKPNMREKLNSNLSFFNISLGIFFKMVWSPWAWNEDLVMMYNGS